ncbi:MAG: YihY/virulence factor BrkB family protein, partial [Planctomycetota bacterium]|nr:YihY/virulence factor BrkB family protein [Planctomycetota bacterium]
MTEMQQQRSSKLERLVEWYDRSEASKSRLTKPLLRVGVFIWFCWRELRRKRAEGMAAELTYRTVFSLIPVLVLGLVLFRVFGGLAEVQTRVESQLYDFFGVPDVMPSVYLESEAADTTSLEEFNTAPANADSSNSTGDSKDLTSDQAVTDIENSISATETNQADDNQKIGVTVETVTKTGNDADSELDGAQDSTSPNLDTNETRSSIRKRMQEVTRFVAAIDFRSIGVLGLLLFVYAAVALANTVEHLFNRIFDVVSHRPFHLRLAIHWSMITLGSGLLAMSLSMSAEVIEWSGSVGANSGVQQGLRQFLSFTASWILLFLLYALIPNIKVSVKAAAGGSLVSALFWELGKYGFQIYVVKAVPYSAIYGSIGLLPLFFLWIYLTWWIVLFGLILTRTLQSFQGQSLRALMLRGSSTFDASADWILPMLVEIGKKFSQGQSISTQQLARRLSISSDDTAKFGDILVENDLAHYLDSAERRLALSRPAEAISICEVIDLTHRMSHARQHEAWQSLGLRDPQSQISKSTSLLELLHKTDEEP